jgi:hypothetical protein
LMFVATPTPVVAMPHGRSTGQRRRVVVEPVVVVTL